MITFTDTPPADVLDAFILASIESAEADAQRRHVASIRAAIECIAAAQVGNTAVVTEAVTDCAVHAAEAVALEGAIAYTRARLAVSRFVAGIRGAR